MESKLFDQNTFIILCKRNDHLFHVTFCTRVQGFVKALFTASLMIVLSPTHCNRQQHKGDNLMSN
jgi:hypothetical protein